MGGSTSWEQPLTLCFSVTPRRPFEIQINGDRPKPFGEVDEIYTDSNDGDGGCISLTLGEDFRGDRTFTAFFNWGEGNWVANVHIVVIGAD